VSARSERLVMGVAEMRVEGEERRRREERERERRIVVVVEELGYRA
jgi:hypothetical protein